MALQTHTDRILVARADELPKTEIAGVVTTDVSSIPNVECIICGWQGHIREVAHDDKDNDICPSCNYSIGLTQREFKLDTNGDVYSLRELAEKPILVGVIKGSRYQNNLFDLLEIEGVSVPLKSEVMDFALPSNGDFSIKRNGDFLFESSHLGFDPVLVHIENGEDQLRIILRFFVRRETIPLG